MKYLKYISALFVFALLAGSSCLDEQKGKSPDLENPKNEPTTYINPVFTPVLADPSVLKADEAFYAYGTEDNWGTEGGHKIVPVVKSMDLVNWEFVNNAFLTKPDWKSAGGIWAPNVSLVGDEYFMYYSFSTWGDPDPGIGLAIASKPEGPFIDQGKLFLSSEIGVDNSIDAFYIEEDGQKYLFWGSFHGIYGIQLTDDGKAVHGEKWKIGHDHLEATYIYKKDGNYVFFGSEGACCEGANSTYRVRVAVADKLLGPYLDKNGNDIAAGVHGEIILSGNTVDYGFAGPGHIGHIITDDEGADWLFYHAIPKSNPLLENGASRRPLMMDRLKWNNGWPEIAGGTPSLNSQEAPVIK